MGDRGNTGNKAGTVNAFVCGWPIEHSRSPLIHRHWLDTYGIDGSYEKIAVEPEALGDLMDAVRSGQYAGGNITVPHKEAALELVDEIDDHARRLGAINTVYMRGRALFGTNTDWIGFRDALREAAPDWAQSAERKTALVLGAGGAARAVVYALAKSGFRQIIVVNRTLARAQSLCLEFSELADCSAVSFADATGAIDENCAIAVNTTSMGMAGGPPLDQAVETLISALPSTAIANDIVYVPLATEFLKRANARGLKTVDGLGMLLHQAAPGFEAWFGVKPRVTKELRDVVLADLGEICL